MRVANTATYLTQYRQPRESSWVSDIGDFPSVLAAARHIQRVNQRNKNLKWRILQTCEVKGWDKYVFGERQ